MRIKELSETSGVPVATIKFYIREKLLKPGELLKPNQASYGPEHLRRLNMIKALIDVGGLKVADAAKVLAAIDSELSLTETFGIAQALVSEDIAEEEVTAESLAKIDAATKTWHVWPQNPGRRAAARVIQTADAVGLVDDAGWVDRYTQAALLVAEADLDLVGTKPDREAMVETVVLGTALGDALFMALRRAAQEHVANQRFPVPPGYEPQHGPDSAPGSEG